MMKHPHEDRMGELYQMTSEGKLRWLGYVTGPDDEALPQGARFDDELKGWVIPAETKTENSK